MKKVIYAMLLAAGVLSFASCNKDDEFRAADQTPYLTSSTRIFALAADGGSRTVIIDTNCPEWKAASDGVWLTVEKKDNTLILSAGANLDKAEQTAVVTVASTSDPALKCTIRVMQYGTGAEDLSADGTANCYLAKTQSAYVFRADVKGNGGGDGGSKYIQKHGLGLDDGVSADLMWEAVFDADKTRSHNVIEELPVYHDGRIWFSTGRQEGNALIALRGFSGEIIWSWHIWVSDKEVTVKTANGYEWMDRNLGALNNIPGDVNNRGMFYQWGRKDPFLPSSAPCMDTEDNRPEANVENHQVGDGSGEWLYSGVRALLLATAPGNIDNAVQHPMSYLMPYYQYSGSSWYVSLANDDLRDSNLWGANSASKGYKTIFDPCPAGYMIPPDGAYAKAAGDMSVGVNMDDQWTPLEHSGRYWTGGTGDFFPFVGLLTISSSALTYCNAIGSYLTGSADPSKGDGYEVYMRSGWVRYRTGATVYGGTIRCVKEKGNDAKSGW